MGVMLKLILIKKNLSEQRSVHPNHTGSHYAINMTARDKIVAQDIADANVVEYALLNAFMVLVPICE